jgi:hypothetical protein
MRQSFYTQGARPKADMATHGRQVRISKERRERRTPPSDSPLELWAAKERLNDQFERTSWGSFVPKRRS